MRKTLASGFQTMRDRAAELSLRAFLNHRFGRFGQVTTLDLDSSLHTLSIEFELKGEQTPVVIRAGSYELIEDQGGLSIIFRDLHASREWIAQGLNEFVAGRKLPLPKALRLGL